MSGDLMKWLRAQLNEDVRGVNEWLRPDPDGLLSTSLRPIHEWVRRDGADRVLREVEAKRRIMAIHRAEPDGEARHWRFPERGCIGCGWDQYEEAAVEDINDCPTLRALALSYADRPGYRFGWAP